MNQMERNEQDYRAALDGLRFSDEAKERMVSNLMEQKEERPMKKWNIRPLRMGLIAAALCAALLGTAGAVQFFGARIDWQVEHPLAEGSNYGAKVDVICFPEDSFPQQVRDLAKQDRLTGKNFKSWVKLEEFLGRDLPDSTALESALPGPHALVSGRGGTNILLCISSCKEGIFSIEATGHYVLDGIWVEQEARLYTDKAEENYKKIGKEFDPGDVLMYEDGSETTEEAYITPSGLTVTIVGVIPPEGAAKFVTEYNAHFSINGIQYRVSAETYAVGYTRETLPEDPAHTLEVLKNVLDGFQV